MHGQGRAEVIRTRRVKCLVTSGDRGGGSGCGDRAAVRPGAQPEDLGSLTPQECNARKLSPAPDARDTRSSGPAEHIQPKLHGLVPVLT